jgi:hypothetical protein
VVAHAHVGIVVDRDRRTASSGDSVAGRSSRLSAHERPRTDCRDLVPAHEPFEESRHEDSTRASERGDRPLPCSIAMKRRMSCEVMPEGSRPADSAASSAPSRA